VCEVGFVVITAFDPDPSAGPGLVHVDLGPLFSNEPLGEHGLEALYQLQIPLNRVGDTSVYLTVIDT
jgi:hypothetical protein